MARKLLLLVSILGLMAIPLKVYSHPGIPYTHDGENHLARFANYKQAIKEGQIPPRFAPNLMNRYGYPVFNYNYPLASILSVPLSVIGLSYIQTFKFLVIVAVAFGAVGIYRLVASSKNEITLGGVVLAEAIFLLHPYLVGSILYRGSIGEVISLSLFPWLWWWLRKTQHTVSPMWWIFGCGIWASYLLAHNVGVLLGVPVLMILALVELKKNWLAWCRWLSSFLMGIGLSLWFWLPALWEKSAVVLDQAGLSTSASLHLPQFMQLLVAPQSFGFSFPGSIDTMSFSIGLLQMFVLVCLTFWLLRSGRQSNSTQLITLGLVWTLVLSQTGLSSWAWELLPLVRFIQFPWRLSMFLGTLLAVALAAEWRNLARWLKIVMLSLVIIQGLYLSRQTAVDYRYLTDIDYEAFPQSTTTANENLPKGFTYLNIGDWQPTPTIQSGAGQIEVQRWSGSDRQYQVKLTQDSLITEPTMFFLGWQTTVTSPTTTEVVEYSQEASVAGRIGYQLSAGEYTVRSRFTQSTPARVIGNTVTALTAVSLFGWLIHQLIVRRNAKQYEV